MRFICRTTIPPTTERYYSFDWGNAHFTALDFNTGPDAGSDWNGCRNDLAATDKTVEVCLLSSSHLQLRAARLRKLGRGQTRICSRRSLSRTMSMWSSTATITITSAHGRSTACCISSAAAAAAPLYPVNPQSFSAYAESTYHTVFVTVDGCTLDPAGDQTGWHGLRFDDADQDVPRSHSRANARLRARRAAIPARDLEGAVMTGWIALHGGGEFQRGSEIGDRRLVVAAGGADARVIVVPTAAAREHPEMAARHGVQWFKQIGAQAAAAMVVDERSANDSAIVATIEIGHADLSARRRSGLVGRDLARFASLARDRESARARCLDRRGQRRRDGVGHARCGIRARAV